LFFILLLFIIFSLYYHILLCRLLTTSPSLHLCHISNHYHSSRQQPKKHQLPSLKPLLKKVMRPKRVAGQINEKEQLTQLYILYCIFHMIYHPLTYSQARSTQDSVRFAIAPIHRHVIFQCSIKNHNISPIPSIYLLN
jgi:hypothetical protein